MEVKEQATSKIEKYLQFDLGNEVYAIPLLTVKEVIPEPPATPLPNSPGYYKGIMNLRGQIISIVDLRSKLNIKPKTEGLEEAVVIIEKEGVQIGLIVDIVKKVLSIDNKDIIEVPEVKSQINAQYVAGVFQEEHGLTILIAIEKVLNIKEISQMQNKAA